MALDEATCFKAQELISMICFPMSMKAILKLGVLEIMSAAGPEAMLSAKDIVSRLGPLCKNPVVGANNLDRIMRVLASKDFFKERLNEDHGCREYGLTPICRNLQLGEPASYGPLLAVLYDEYVARAWQRLDEAVLSGTQPEFLSAEEMMGKQSPVAMFNQAMAAQSKIDLMFVLEAYRGFEGIGTLVDVGGGLGASIGAIKAKYPHIRAINFDQAHVARENIPGVEHVEGDMFKGGIPKAEACFIKRALHDWSDEKAVEILKNCYQAIPKDGKVIVVDVLLPSGVDHTQRAQLTFAEDLCMLMTTGGGQERTLEGFRKIATAAGFSKVVHAATVSDLAVIELHK